MRSFPPAPTVFISGGEEAPSRGKKPKKYKKIYVVNNFIFIMSKRLFRSSVTNM